MSAKELDRLKVLREVKKRHICSSSIPTAVDSAVFGFPA